MWKQLWNWTASKNWKNFEMHDRECLICTEQIFNRHLNFNLDANGKRAQKERRTMLLGTGEGGSLLHSSRKLGNAVLQPYGRQVFCDKARYKAKEICKWNVYSKMQQKDKLRKGLLNIKKPGLHDLENSQPLQIAKDTKDQKWLLKAQ